MNAIKIIITEQGKTEIARLQFDIISAINKIIAYVPKPDLINISHIFITDLPLEMKEKSAPTHAAYFAKFNRKPAYIEVYLKNVFLHIKSAESFSSMLPIQEYGLAISIFHEIGHHVRVNRTHNIGKDRSEKYAELYAKKLERQYIIKNASNINICLENLHIMAQQGKLSSEIVRKMKEGWQKKYKEIISELEEHNT